MSCVARCAWSRCGWGVGRNRCDLEKRLGGRTTAAPRWTARSLSERPRSDFPAATSWSGERSGLAARTHETVTACVEACSLLGWTGCWSTASGEDDPQKSCMPAGAAKWTSCERQQVRRVQPRTWLLLTTESVLARFLCSSIPDVVTRLSDPSEQDDVMVCWLSEHSLRL